MISETDLDKVKVVSPIYLAGLCDGEACFGIYNGRPEVQITQNDSTKSQMLFKFLKWTFGGSIVKGTKSKNTKSSWIKYKVSNRKALEFCLYIKKWIIFKKDDLNKIVKHYQATSVEV